MKIMVFIDYDNFCQSIWGVNQRRKPHISKLPDFLMDYIRKKLGWEKYNPRLIRTYCYTGEYASTTIGKIKKHYDEEKDVKTKEEIKKLLEDSVRRQGKIGEGGQKDFFYKANDFQFFEIKSKPLQYSPTKRQVFQKGIDVQLAVDLVAHAYNNSFDAAIVCSGDVDLLEALKLVKNLGKKIIIFSHTSNTAKEVRKEADYFIKLNWLEEDDYNKFSYLMGEDN